ncbi:MAG: 3-dehydroquinate synthase II [Nitrososphaerota archaeon]|nr:3-dehydroquinate synthase II [Candidatus Bathyarchaeota archaeon]MDW8048485.1 3-dehydroquinate synthase II [Nitrososphaerota archaeon]
MREFWVRVDPSLNKDEKIELIKKTASLVSAFVVDSGDTQLVRDLSGKIIVSPSDNSDIKLVGDLESLRETKMKGKKACMEVIVKSKADEKKVIEAAHAHADYVVIECPDWKVIPLENLIAEIHDKTLLLATVSNIHEAKLILETLEIGADGIVTNSHNVKEIYEINGIVKNVKTRAEEIEKGERILLQQAKVVETKPLGSGARVCIDTCDIMKAGEGLLLGCQSSGFFLVEAEVHETQFVAPRPFRVNAGSIALYVLVPGGKTKYLSELRAGDEVLIVDREGKTRVTNICRVKIEWRPLLLVDAECEGRRIKVILQDAETIRLVTEDGSRSVREIKEGEKVLVHLEEGGRHFGTLVKEERVIER